MNVRMCPRSPVAWRDMAWTGVGPKALAKFGWWKPERAYDRDDFLEFAVLLCWIWCKRTTCWWNSSITSVTSDHIDS